MNKNILFIIVIILSATYINSIRKGKKSNLKKDDYALENALDEVCSKEGWSNDCYVRECKTDTYKAASTCEWFKPQEKTKEELLIEKCWAGQDYDESIHCEKNECKKPENKDLNVCHYYAEEIKKEEFCKENREDPECSQRHINRKCEKADTMEDWEKCVEEACKTDDGKNAYDCMEVEDDDDDVDCLANPEHEECKERKRREEAEREVEQACNNSEDYWGCAEKICKENEKAKASETCKYLKEEAEFKKYCQENPTDFDCQEEEATGDNHVVLN